MSYIRSPYSESSFKRFIRTGFAVTPRQYLTFAVGCFMVILLAGIFAITERLEMNVFLITIFGAYGVFFLLTVLAISANRLQRTLDYQKYLYEMQQINADPQRLRQFQLDVERGREYIRRAGVESLLHGDQDVIQGEVISRRDH